MAQHVIQLAMCSYGSFLEILLLQLVFLILIHVREIILCPVFRVRELLTKLDFWAGNLLCVSKTCIIPNKKEWKERKGKEKSILCAAFPVHFVTYKFFIATLLPDIYSLNGTHICLCFSQSVTHTNSAKNMKRMLFLYCSNFQCIHY